MDAAAPSHEFPPTRWTLVQDVALQKEKALERLLHLYSRPLLAWARWRYGAEDPEDLVQEALLDVCEAPEKLAALEEGQGTFRSWLCAVLNHKQLERARHGAREKRGGGKIPLPLDTLTEELPALGGLTPETAFDREVALRLLLLVRNRLRATYTGQGRLDLYCALWSRVPERAGGEGEAPWEALGLARAAFDTSLKRFRQRVREEFANDLPPEEYAESCVDTVRYLMALTAPVWPLP